MAWATTKDTSSIPVLEAFLRRYPSGIYADMAQARLQELKQMKEAREQEARQRTAMAHPPAPPAAAVVPPARTSPSPAPDSLTRPEAIKRISVWIERDARLGADHHQRSQPLRGDFRAYLRCA
jgi:hypothetical protein